MKMNRIMSLKWNVTSHHWCTEPPIGSVSSVQLNMGNFPVCWLTDNLRVNLGKMKIFLKILLHWSRRYCIEGPVTLCQWYLQQHPKHVLSTSCLFFAGLSFFLLFPLSPFLYIIHPFCARGRAVARRVKT